eukprot:SRR837773.2974.p1 GENE.SRR837773.2974~~SRR837773.2974.p1  ORF type:complete len:506 (-),score=195.67 SRR837773.2974:13-1494(-)
MVPQHEDIEAEQGLLQAEVFDGAPAAGRPRRRLVTGLLAAAGVAGTFALVGSAASSTAASRRQARHEQAFEGNVQALSRSFTGLSEAGCRDAKEGDSCYFSVNWAMTNGIYSNPEWYKGLTPSSSFVDFQNSLYESGAKNCTGFKPCHLKEVQAAEAKAAAAPAPPPGPRAQTFYMYRAQSKASYPLENINTADLAGVFWYLHNEVIVATPRKYKIDRIKRFKVTVKNTWEFWNVHKRQFGAFVAYDAGGCTTPICKDIYHQYGFIVGCQVQPLSVAGYLGRHQTNWQCRAGEDKCRAPIWYALPGPCPAKGMPNGDIDPNSDDLDVNKYKSADCIKRMPGGLCPKGTVEPTGAPDCTYTYEEAGEIFLDELVGLTPQYQDYNDFWNVSFTRCAKDVASHVLPAGHVCRHNKEYSKEADAGVGTDFWDGIHDTEKCTARLDKARQLFKKNFPQFPEHLDEPACEFDMYYGDEFKWPINHTHSPHSEWWAQRMD